MSNKLNTLYLPINRMKINAQSAPFASFCYRSHLCISSSLIFPFASVGCFALPHIFGLEIWNVHWLQSSRTYDSSVSWLRDWDGIGKLSPDPHKRIRSLATYKTNIFVSVVSAERLERYHSVCFAGSKFATATRAIFSENCVPLCAVVCWVW